MAIRGFRMSTMADPSNTIDFSVFQQLDARVGRIISVEIAEGCRVSAYKLELDFGPEIGTRHSIAQATNYPPEALLGRQVLAVITDARFSGVSTGACIGHVGPEALAGGPIGKVLDGDLIEIVIDRNSLEGTVNLIGVRAQRTRRNSEGVP